MSQATSPLSSPPCSSVPPVSPVQASDLHLSRRFDLRAEYRGLLYKNPDFQTGGDPYSKQLTLTNEPTLSSSTTSTNPNHKEKLFT